MRTYVIASVMIILSLLVIAWKGALEANHWLIPYLAEVSSALLVGGLLSLLFKLMHDRESEATLRRLLRIHDSVDELGLREILPEVQGYSFISLLSEADHLAIVMNDGHRWVGNHSVALQARFSTSSETEFFLVDPDSPFVESLAKKTSTTVDDLKKKIRETYVLIEAAYKNSEKKGRVTIYRIATYPTKSMFFSESKLIETPYQTASGRAQIPVFEYQKVARQDSPYSFAERDIKAMRGESQVEKRLGHGEES